MSYFVSPVLGMSLPNAGTSQAFEITVQNANMALIEGGFTADRTTLGTHTTQIATLNNNSGRGTLADYKVATPAALQALSTMVQGDTAVMVGDGTNFSLATFQYNGSKWACTFIEFLLETTAALAAVVTYINVATNTNLILTGATGWAPSGMQFSYMTAYNAGTNPLGRVTTAGFYSTIPSGRFKGTITTAKAVAASARWGVSTGPTFDATDDPDSIFSSATGLVTFVKSGTYLVFGQTKATAATANVSLVAQKNGANAISSWLTASVAFAGATLLGQIRVLPGDTFSVSSPTAYTTASDTPADNNFIALQHVSW